MQMYISKLWVCYGSVFEHVLVFPIAFGTNKKALTVVRLLSADVMGVSPSEKVQQNTAYSRFRRTSRQSFSAAFHTSLGLLGAETRGDGSESLKFLQHGKG
jgi:hypothetical protein